MLIAFKKISLVLGLSLLLAGLGCGSNGGGSTQRNNTTLQEYGYKCTGGEPVTTEKSAIDGAEKCASCDDGKNWITQTSGTYADLYAITVSDSRLVAVGSGGTILTSDDHGVTWTRLTSRTTQHLYGVSSL